ncbi:MAG: RNA methyltransferase [Spirochaetaceae bacterium]|jgi:TrmH RNA methyltransferase|nr:RNA methyltransferase [Spirochaetaceae bacterium]
MTNKLLDELAICGLNAVKARAQFNPDSVNRFFLREDRLPLFTGLCGRLAARKRPYKITNDAELEKICKTGRHQGVVAMVEKPEIEPLGREDLSLWNNESKTGVVLHSIGNDHNLGAIIRCAAFFDAYFVVISEEDREKTLTTSACRVAEGGVEHVHFRSVRRTEAFLREASQVLFVAGASSRSRRRIDEIDSLIAEKTVGGKRPGIALVFGNEETGLPDYVEEECPVLLRIPGSGNIESLNVSCAASVFLQRVS